MSATPFPHGWCEYRSDGETSSWGSRRRRSAVRRALWQSSAVPRRGERSTDNVGRATFSVALDTAHAMIVTDAELAPAFTAVAASGGSDISVLRDGDGRHTRVEFDLEAHDCGHASQLALSMLEALGELTPSVPGGWIFASLSPAWPEEPRFKA